MNSIIILGICVVIAAIIIVVGYGYFSARSSIGCQIGEPNCVKNFVSSSISITSVSTTISTTRTTTSTSTTIPYETVVQITTGLPSLGTQTVHITGTFAWEHLNKSNGYYVITNNLTAVHGGGSNDSLTFANNNQNSIILSNVGQGYSCFPGTAEQPNAAFCMGFGNTIFTGYNYTFTGELEYGNLKDGSSAYVLNLTNAAALNFNGTYCSEYCS